MDRVGTSWDLTALIFPIPFHFFLIQDRKKKKIIEKFFSKNHHFRIVMFSFFYRFIFVDFASKLVLHLPVKFALQSEYLSICHKV